MSATALLRNPYLFDSDSAWAECSAAADVFGPGKDLPDRSITAALEYLYFAKKFTPAGGMTTVRDHLRTIFEVTSPARVLAARDSGCRRLRGCPGVERVPSVLVGILHERQAARAAAVSGSGGKMHCAFGLANCSLCFAAPTAARHCRFCAAYVLAGPFLALFCFRPRLCSLLTDSV